MKILVVTGSPRKQGNTEIMAEVFAAVAVTAGHQVTLRKLSGLAVHPCRACEYCFKHDGVCVQKDDMNGLLQELEQADVLVLASPIYWFDVSAQLKCFVDRMYAHNRKGFHVQSVAMLLNSASKDVYAAAEAQLKDIAAYLKWENKGAVKISGMQAKGDMKDAADLEKVRAFAQGL